MTYKVQGINVNKIYETSKKVQDKFSAAKIS